MSKTTGELVVKTEIVAVESFDLGVADDAIEGLRLRVEGTKADTANGMKLITGAISECLKMKRQARGNHTDLKEVPLRLCQALDADLRRVTALIDNVHNPLKIEKQRVVDNKERLKQEALDAIRKAEEALARAEVERLRKEKEARDAQIKQEQEIEAKRLESDRQELEALRQEALRKNQEAERSLAEQRRLVEAERRELDENRRKLEAEETRKREAIEKENRELAEAKAETERKEEMLRLAEERKPDGEKLTEFADIIDAVVGAPVQTDWAKALMSHADIRLSEIANDLRGAVVAEG